MGGKFGRVETRDLQTVGTHFRVHESPPPFVGLVVCMGAAFFASVVQPPISNLILPPSNVLDSTLPIVNLKLPTPGPKCQLLASYFERLTSSFSLLASDLLLLTSSPWRHASNFQLTTSHSNFNFPTFDQ